MKRLLLSCLLFAQFFIPRCVSSQSSDQKYNGLASDIRKIVSDTKVVGVSIAIIENYQILWTGAFGLKEIGTQDSVTTETIFQAASITKSITALAVMREVQDGKVSLDSSVNTYLKDWKIPGNYMTRNNDVTVRQLLSHTGGVANNVLPFAYEVNEKVPSLTQALKGEKPAKNEPVAVTYYPGRMYSYSGPGYGILQKLVEDLEGKEFTAIVDKRIFEPLKMRSSTFDYYLPNENFKSFASGHLKGNELMKGRYQIFQPLTFASLWSTPTDLAKVLIEMQLSLKGSSNKILNQQNAQLMIKPDRITQGKYGLGFYREGRGGVSFFGHGGHNYGYISSMFGSPEGGFGMVIMTNSENGWKAINKINKLVGRRLWGF